MMRLMYAAASPFVRKVVMTARIKGVFDQLSLELGDTRGAHNPLLIAANPLAKIPSLVLADGIQLFDSRVICEYLDSLAPTPPLYPASGMDRYRCLTRVALADGIMDAALLIVYEDRYRPADKHVPEWLARQQAKIDHALSALNASPPAWTGQPDAGDIALACALGYLDLRFNGTWRPAHPALVAWLGRFAAAVPAYDATMPVG